MQVLGVNLGVTFTSTTPTKPREPRPGLMIFKHAFTRSKAPTSSPSIVLAYLVPESPISGIKKAVLNRSLNLGSATDRVAIGPGKCRSDARLDS